MLSVQGLGLHHSGTYLFQNVNFTIKKDDKIGLVGKNEAGVADGGGSSPTEIGIYGAFAQAAFDLLKESMKDQLDLTFENGIVRGKAVKGATLSEAASWLLEAINNPDIKVRLDTVAGFFFYDNNKKDYVFFEGDAFRGSFSSEGKVITTNIVSPEVSKGYDIASGSPIGTTVLHSALEGYFGGKYFPNTTVKSGEPDTDAYIVSHFFSSWIDPNYKDLPNYYKIDKGTKYSNGVLDSNEAKIIDSRTQNVIYTFPKFKYSK